MHRVLFFSQNIFETGIETLRRNRIYAVVYIIGDIALVWTNRFFDVSDFLKYLLLSYTWEEISSRESVQDEADWFVIAILPYRIMFT